MKNEVVTFEQALELCKLGFDESTCCGYLIENRELYLCQIEDEEFYKPEKDLHAPLKHQAFKWFMERNIHGFVIYSGSPDMSGNQYCYTYLNSLSWNNSKPYKTYEEAESACIDKLIEIRNNQTK